MAHGDTASTHVQYSEVATTGAYQPTPPPSAGGHGSDDNATPGAGGDGALPAVAKPSVVRSFVRLLRDNGAFRALWIAGFISNVGDWFNEVAIIALLQRLDGSNMLPIACVASACVACVLSYLPAAHAPLCMLLSCGAAFAVR